MHPQLFSILRNAFRSVKRGEEQAGRRTDPANFSISPSIGISGIALSPDKKEIIFTASSMMAEGTTYTVTTGRFWIWEEEYLPNKVTRFKGCIVPPSYYSAAGDDTYENVITAFCTAFGKTAVFKDPAADWLAYQFFPTGKSVILNDANRFTPRQVVLLLREIRTRLGYLGDVGLAYLTLDRQSRTLSGG